MIKFETDNQVIEELLETALANLLRGKAADDAVTLSQPMELPKLKPLPTVTRLNEGGKPEPSILREAEYETVEEAPTLGEYVKPSRKEMADGFPVEWKKRVRDKISARTAFFAKDIYESNAPGNQVTAFRRYLYELDGVIYERLHSILGSPLLIIPCWQDAHGITQFARNASALKSRLVKAARQPDSISDMSLNDQEIQQLINLGIAIPG